MSRMAFLTRVLAFSHVVPPSLSSDGPRRAGVLLDEIEPFDRDEQLVLARVAELHELLRLESDVDALQADEHADAVIDVHDQVVRPSDRGNQRGRCGSPIGGARAPCALPRRRRSRPRTGVPPPAGGTRATDGRCRRARPRVRLLGAFDRSGEDLVVGEELDRALGTARRSWRSTTIVSPALAASADLGDPLGDAAGELERRLTGDVCRRVTKRERFERGGAVASHVLPPPHSSISSTEPAPGGPWRRASSWLAWTCWVELDSVRAHLVRLGHDDGGPAAGPEIVEDGRRSVRRRPLRRSAPAAARSRLIERAGRALRRGVVRADRFDRVADELEPDRLARAGGEEVHHAAAHAELAGFVDRILPRIAGGGEQIAQVGRGDLLSGVECERDCRQAIRQR